MWDKWNGLGQGISTASKTTDGPRVLPLGDHKKYYDKKRRQGRPAKRWRDDLDKYWSDTIWPRTAQYRLTWRRHAEAFAQPRDTTAAQWWWWWQYADFYDDLCPPFRDICVYAGAAHEINPSPWNGTQTAIAYVCVHTRRDLRVEYKRHYARICVNSFAQLGLRSTAYGRQASHTPPHDASVRSISCRAPACVNVRQYRSNKYKRTQKLRKRLLIFKIKIWRTSASPRRTPFTSSSFIPWSSWTS